MSRDPRDLPATLDEAFACADALAQGVSRRRLRAGDLDRPFRGARLRPLPLDRFGDGDSDEPLALAAALAAHDLPLRAGWRDEPLAVGIHPPAHAPRARGIRGLKVAPSMVRVCRLEGLDVSDAATTWALCALTLDVDTLIVLGDALVRVPRDHRGIPLPDRQKVTPDDLRAAALVPWRRGRERLLGALEEIRVGSMSVLETELRLAVVRGGLPEPELDVDIRAADGSLIGVCDAVYRRERTVVEVEGRHHRTSDRQWNRDLDKYAALAAAGWEVVRVTSRHVRGQGPTAVDLVRAALARARAR